MMGFYNNLININPDSKSKSNDVRDQAKKTVETRTNIDKILDEKEAVREVERKVKDEKRNKAIMKEMQQVLVSKLNPKSDTNTKKRDIKEESKKTEETAEEKQQRLKKEKELKIALAKQRYQERKETHS